MRSHLSIAFVTIGYSPRKDIVPELIEEMLAGIDGRDVETSEHGVLDGLAGEDLPTMLAEPGELSFVTRGTGGTEIVLSAARVEARLHDLLLRLDERGHDMIVLLCTGTVIPQLRKTLVLEAQKIVDHAIEAMAGTERQLGIVLPLERQIDEFRTRHGYSSPVRFAACSPYAAGDPAGAADALGSCDAAVMHCMGYSRDMRDAMRERLQAPVLHARGIVAGFLRHSCERDDGKRDNGRSDMTFDITRRSLLASGVAALGLWSLPASSFERTPEGNVLVFGGRQEIPILDPHVRYDWSIRMAQQALYDALVKYVGPDAAIEPWLAKSWETSEDGLTWTFHLVDNARFHNGDPVNAEAVRYSFERALKLNKGVAWMLSDVLGPEGVTAVDDLTVRFVLNKPFAPFLSFLPWWYIVNPAQVEANAKDGDYGQDWLIQNSAGSGPFRQGRWEQNVLYELTSNPDYWRGWPQGEKRLASIIYRVIREAAAQKAAVQRGEADIVEGLTSDDFTQLTNVPGIAIEDHVGMTAFAIKFNNQRGPTADVNLRKAIAHAFDYDALVAVYNGGATLLDSPFSKAIQGHVTVPEMPRRDLDKAREYLAMTDTPDGGITLKYVYPAGHEESRRIALIMLDSLRALNITIEPQPEQWPNVVALGADVETAPSIVSVFTTPLSTDPDAVAYLYHRNSWGKYYGMSYYDNPEVDGWIEEARATIDWSRRQELYAKIQTQLVADQPEIFGMTQNRRWARRDYVKGFEFNPVRFISEIDLYPLWIDAE